MRTTCRVHGLDGRSSRRRFSRDAHLFCWMPMEVPTSIFDASRGGAETYQRHPAPHPSLHSLPIPYMDPDRGLVRQSRSGWEGQSGQANIKHFACTPGCRDAFWPGRERTQAGRERGKRREKGPSAPASFRSARIPPWHVSRRGCQRRFGPWAMAVPLATRPGPINQREINRGERGKTRPRPGTRMPPGPTLCLGRCDEGNQRAGRERGREVSMSRLPRVFPRDACWSLRAAAGTARI